MLYMCSRQLITLSFIKNCSVVHILQFIQMIMAKFCVSVCTEYKLEISLSSYQIKFQLNISVKLRYMVAFSKLVFQWWPSLIGPTSYSMIIFWKICSNDILLTVQTQTKTYIHIQALKWIQNKLNVLYALEKCIPPSEQTTFQSMPYIQKFSSLIIC